MTSVELPARLSLRESAQWASSIALLAVVLVFAARETMDIMRQFGRKPYQSLVDRLKDRKVAFIDYGDLFVNERELSTWYVPNDGHFNAVGNRHVAEAIVRTIRTLDEGKAPQS